MVGDHVGIPDVVLFVLHQRISIDHQQNQDLFSASVAYFHKEQGNVKK